MINRVVLVGRLTRDPEVRKTQTGLSVCSFTLACDRAGKKEEGQQTADFISCVAWRQSADFLNDYAAKGSMIGVDGKIQTRSYEKDGQRVYTTEVLADSVQLLESKTSARRAPAATTSAKTESFVATPADIFDGADEIPSEELPF